LKTVITIVVSFNGANWIESCLTSLAHSQYPTKIVLIDNCSTDNTLEIVKRTGVPVVLIETGKNIGFGKANNLGIEFAIIAEYDYIFLLNQDAWVEPSTISVLVEEMEKNDRYGILSPMHVNREGSELDRYFLQYLLQSDSTKYINELLFDDRFGEQIVNTKFVNAAAWMMTRACLIKTGGFDPLFFHYGEDRNYSNRAIFHGFKIGISPKCKIYHDRANRTDFKERSKEQQFKHDFTNLLVYMSDIRQEHLVALTTRRLIRHCWLVMKGIFKRDSKEMWINCRILFYTIKLLPKIKKSRQIACGSGIPPFLAVQS
jgi:GT2 family glycosyltransferase